MGQMFMCIMFPVTHFSAVKVLAIQPCAPAARPGSAFSVLTSVMPHKKHRDDREGETGTCGQLEGHGRRVREQISETGQ